MRSKTSKEIRWQLRSTSESIELISPDQLFSCPFASGVDEKHTMPFGRSILANTCKFKFSFQLPSAHTGSRARNETRNQFLTDLATTRRDRCSSVSCCDLSNSAASRAQRILVYDLAITRILCSTTRTSTSFHRSVQSSCKDTRYSEESFCRLPSYQRKWL